MGLAVPEGIELLENLQIEATKRGALVPGDERLIDRATGITIISLLIQKQAYDRFHTGEEDGPLLSSVLVRQGQIGHGQIALSYGFFRKLSHFWRGTYHHTQPSARQLVPYPVARGGCADLG